MVIKYICLAMNRKKFIENITASIGFMGLVNLKTLAQSLDEVETTMPVLFIGHGSPMNAIEDNTFTRGWKNIAQNIPRPQAILFISAHWLTKGSYVSSAINPETIHDFGGFPETLFATQYPAPGAPDLANDILGLYPPSQLLADPNWGLDHGAWLVAKPMYPDADIPTLQLSIDYYQSAEYHYQLAKQLLSLRKKGVLIIGSGNMVHNLGKVNFNLPDQGEDWAVEINEIFYKKIMEGDHSALIAYQKLHASIHLAIPTPDHYFPLMYCLALQQPKDEVSIFNNQAVYGSLTMTSVKIG
jgi:4,5-DOPA dioxygenase extradiol